MLNFSLFWPQNQQMGTFQEKTDPGAAPAARPLKADKVLMF